MPKPPPGIVPPEALYKNPNRKSIHDVIKKKPGLTRHHIANDLDLNYKTVAHHVRILQEHNEAILTDSHRGTENLCFTAKDEKLLDEPTAILYGQEPLRNLALYIAEHHGCTSEETAEALNKTTSTLHDQTPILIEHGLIERAPLENHYYYRATETLKRWARTTGRHYERPWKDE